MLPKSSNKLYNIFNIIIALSLVIAFPVTIWLGSWYNSFLVLLTFGLILISWKAQEKYDFKLPGEMEIILVLFIYTGLFLGGVANLYHTFEHLDSVLHLISGFGLGFFGFLIPYSLYKSGKLKASPLIIVIFGFCFALSLGVLWEIFEFGMDHFFGLDMQRTRNLGEVYGYVDTRLGIIDTMKDLILDAIGALVASVAGYFYLKRGEFFIFDRLVERVENKNPDFFN